MGKKKKCGCICCHKKVSNIPKRQQHDRELNFWNVYVCSICGYEFCEKPDQTGGRKYPEDLLKKKEPTDWIGGSSLNPDLWEKPKK